jgi:cytochrome c biogenesis protein CcmG/thiol:disulfide interchange protein DsbE
MTDNVPMNTPTEEPQAAEGQPRRLFTPFSIVVFLVVGALLVVLALQLANANQGQPNRGPAPDFTLELFEEMGGGEFTLSENRGKVIVINFWASWCGPCRDEAPALQQVWEAYRDTDQVVIVGVDYVDNTADALGYINEFGITYPNGPDLGTRISDDYHIQGVPETFVVGKDGNVFRFIYAGVSARELADIIDQALAQ